MSPALLDAAGKAGMPIVSLCLALITGQNYLFGIYDNDIIATIEVWSECGLMLATQTVGDDRSRAADDQSVCIDEHPLFLNILGASRVGFHGVSRSLTGLSRQRALRPSPVRPECGARLSDHGRYVKS